MAPSIYDTMETQRLLITVFVLVYLGAVSKIRGILFGILFLAQKIMHSSTHHQLHIAQIAIKPERLSSI